MKLKRTYKIIAVFLLFTGLAACKSTDSTKKDTTEDENTEKLEELYWAQKENSRMSFTKDDVMFMTGMIAHHAQALIMSELAPKNDASAAVQRLAARIINAQKDEIDTMQQWLRDRDQPVPEITIDGLNLHVEIEGEPYTHYRHMQGVLSQEQIQELANARGSDFDQLFLKYMIEHHAGAVHMVENLFDTDGAAQDEQAFRLASDIQVDQRTEIKRMRLMLENITESS